MAEKVGYVAFTPQHPGRTMDDMSPAAARHRSKTVLCLAFDDIQVLDLVGPHEVFSAITTTPQREGYDVRVVSATPGRVVGSGGLGLYADALPDPADPVDTLVIPGGDGARAMPAASSTVSWIRQAAPHVRRIATVCTGAFLAGRAGLLEGRKVATHWSRTAQLQTEFPSAQVDTDRLYMRDGQLWSSGGVTAGIDLALALVEQDHGGQLAQAVARHLVMTWRRPGGQSQYAAPMWAPRAVSSPIVLAQQLIESDPGADHRVGVLARSVNMSERNFARMFTREVGQPPARYVERMRLGVARVLLETDVQTITAIAARCGFGTSETMRRSFIRHLGVSPEKYRSQFDTSGNSLANS